MKKYSYNFKPDRTLDICDLANFIITQYNKSKEEIDRIKLEYILYYIQGYFYKFFGKPAFNSAIKKVSSGPQITDLHYQSLIALSHGNLTAFNKVPNHYHVLIAQLLDDILHETSFYSTKLLYDKISNEKPIFKTEINDEINKKLLSGYFHDYNPLNIDQPLYSYRKKMKLIKTANSVRGKSY